MSREIKFRQPRLDDKGNFIDWFYWGFIDSGFIAPLRHDIDSYQFTGLKDKKGKKIYHKDKVEITFPNGQKFTGVVVWDFLSWQIEGGGMLSNFDEDCLEVVGFENPELMEKQ